MGEPKADLAHSGSHLNLLDSVIWLGNPPGNMKENGSVGLPGMVTGATARMLNPTRWRFRLASMVRQWKRSGRFLLTCLFCVFVLEMIIHEGQGPFHSNKRALYYQSTDYEIQIQDGPGPAAANPGLFPRALKNPQNQPSSWQQFKVAKEVKYMQEENGKGNMKWPSIDNNFGQKADELFAKFEEKKIVQPQPTPAPTPEPTLPPAPEDANINPTHIFRNMSVSLEARVDDLVQRLSVEEIIAQTTAVYSKATPGISRLGIKPFVWITECISGQTSTTGTAFPQAIALAATFSPDTLAKIGEAVSHEVRAHWNENAKRHKYHTFYGLNCMSPSVDLLRHPLWGRNQETFGEDPFLTSLYAFKYVIGMQGTDKRYARISVACRHFAAHSGPENASDTFDAQVSLRDLHTNYLPQFRACVRAGALGVVCGENKVNGVPSCANKYLLNNVLRKDWGFNGFVMSDNGAIEKICRTHKYNKTLTGSVTEAIRAGTNLEITSGNSVYKNQKEALKNKALTETQIRNNVKPLFLARMKLGEFDPPGSNPYNELEGSEVQSLKHRQWARQTAMMSFVLLKNDNNVLPLNGKVKMNRIAVIGPYANNTRGMYGSLAPQVNHLYATSPLQGLSNLANKVLYIPACKDKACETYDQEKLKNVVSGVDMIFVCLGTDNEVSGKDRAGLQLPGKQMKVLQEAANANTKAKVVLLLFNGGPVEISWARDSPRVSSILECWFPGQAAADAIYRVLTRTGDHSSPAGRLPATWPMPDEQLADISDYESSNSISYRYIKKEPLYPFGYGLSYTTFEYKKVVVSPTDVKAWKDLKVTVTITNKGSQTADEVIQVYISWNKDINVPQHQLAAIRRISIKGQTTSTFDLVVKGQEMAVWMENSKRFVVVPGDMKLYVGGQQPNQVTKADSNVLETSFTIIR